MKTRGKGHISVLAAWALAFGCAIGWDAMVMPWTVFLPKAGPLGTAFGLVVGGLLMLLIAWNYHYMMNRIPKQGGVYAYATAAFGHDHGFLCAWFFALTNIAIVCSDATALTIVLRYIFGDGFSRFGFHYTAAGFDICLGDICLSAAGVLVIIAACIRRRISRIVQTTLAIVFAAGFLLCSVAAAARHTGGFASMRPLLSPTGGSNLFQFLSILTITPWLFVGFEALSNISEDFKFPRRKAFGIMAATIVSTVAAYAILTAIPVLAHSDVNASWAKAIADVADPNVLAFNVAARPLGGIGRAVVCISLIGAIFTNLIGNTVVASRITSAMAVDGALPAWLGRKRGDGSPQNAILVIAGLSLIVSPFGMKAIGIILDIAIIGAVIAYAYTSAATFKIARREGYRLAQVTGIAGLVVSVVIGLMFLLPIFTSKIGVMSTESYLLLVLWCIAGLSFFLLVFRQDSRRRFGRSTVVWTSLFAMILIVSIIWARQRTHESTAMVYGNVAGHYGAGDDMRGPLGRNLSAMNRSMVGTCLVQTGMSVLAIVLMYLLYSILRRRERDIEREKSKAKSYFFSTVSHDIRTPMNAILGFSEVLKDDFLSAEERAEALDSIIVSGKALLALINDVLDFSKLESGKMGIKLEPTDCQALLHDVLTVFKVAGENPDVDLRLHADGLPLLMLDPQRLRQIAFNLVGNAVKFTEKGHVELRASFKPVGGGGTGIFRLAVEDTGCGISADDLHRIASPYEQVDLKGARNGGTGMGIAICKHLAAAMGGELEVASEVGKGSLFKVTIRGVSVAAQTHARPDGPQRRVATP